MPRISYSAANTYSTCGRKYQYHYLHKLRSNVMSGALLFGSAMDKSLNHLLETKNLQETKDLWGKSFRWQEINKVNTYLPEALNVVYAEKDFDSDLVYPGDEEKFTEFKAKHGIDSDQSLKQLTNFYKKLKKEQGFANLADNQKLVYNYGHWVCLNNKGLLLIDAYYAEIIPRIKNVLAVQKKFSLKNKEDDEIIGYIDIIAELDDGKVYILDNKTSGSRYEQDSAGKSQQLILYNYVEKENYKLEGVGYFVLYKQILKDKTKICTICGHDGSEARHKKCPAEIEGKRCNGEWKETVKLKGETEVILNQVTEASETLVLDTFDLVNDGIKKGVFNPNLNACEQYGQDFRCAYFDKCWKGKDDSLIKS